MTEDQRIADLSGLNKRVRDVMLSGRIKAVLPVSAVQDGGRLLGIYSLENMVPVTDSIFSPVNILELTGRIMKMTEELLDNLISPENIVFSKEVIFIDMNSRKTRICVIPHHRDTGGIKESVSCLLGELKELTDERGRAYIDVFTERYMKSHMSIDRIMAFLEELKREAGME